MDLVKTPGLMILYKGHKNIYMYVYIFPVKIQLIDEYVLKQKKHVQIVLNSQITQCL